ncbi:MAG: hypothetical protein ACI4OZ_01790, partial [Akkermansia sp.]
MKPHLPLSLLRAVLACFTALTATTFTASATELTIPNSYTSVEIDDAEDFSTEYANSNIAFLLAGSTSLTLNPTICSWWSTSDSLFTGTNYIFTSQNTANPGSLTFDGGTTGAPSAFRQSNGGLEFYALGNLQFCKLLNEIGTDRSDISYGGAINASRFSPLKFNGNVGISFNNNHAYSENSSAEGGGICTDTCSAMSFSENGSISFIGNYASSPHSEARGGAIYLAPTTSAYGSRNGSVSFNRNGDIAFTSNYVTTTSGVSSGGAVSMTTDSSVSFVGNGNITFSNNYAITKTGNATGGAISGSGSVLTFSENGKISFQYNYVEREESGVAQLVSGGAITLGAGSTFILRGEAEFLRNYECIGGAYRLRSLSLRGESGKQSSMELSAP